MVELLEGHFIGGTAPGRLPAVYDQEWDFSIPGQKFCYDKSCWHHRLQCRICDQFGQSGSSTEKYRPATIRFLQNASGRRRQRSVYSSHFYTVFRYNRRGQNRALVVLQMSGQRTDSRPLCDACLLTVLWAVGLKSHTIKGNCLGRSPFSSWSYSQSMMAELRCGAGRLRC